MENLVIGYVVYLGTGVWHAVRHEGYRGAVYTGVNRPSAARVLSFDDAIAIADYRNGYPICQAEAVVDYEDARYIDDDHLEILKVMRDSAIRKWRSLKERHEESDPQALDWVDRAVLQKYANEADMARERVEKVYDARNSYNPDAGPEDALSEWRLKRVRDRASTDWQKILAHMEQEGDTE